MAIDLDDPRPSYLQLAELLKSDIAAGRYEEGAKLPAVRDLASRFQMSNATAARAVNVLQQDGIVVSRPGVGTIVRNLSAATTPTITEQLEDLQRRVAVLEARQSER